MTLEDRTKAFIDENKLGGVVLLVPHAVDPDLARAQGLDPDRATCYRARIIARQSISKTGMLSVLRQVVDGLLDQIVNAPLDKS